jgi:hypothetical protein
LPDLREKSSRIGRVRTQHVRDGHYTQNFRIVPAFSQTVGGRKCVLID